ncbi:MAG: UDP-N-acetylmuramoyl-tripeptide--D-alanyl-D-alanine ligase [Bacteroidales bacterium]|nr:UDP-N-acetylmuramoyl-tripeptide--D-alanyl-D-alanine ligase [Bacteroidales bacterium]
MNAIAELYAHYLEHPVVTTDSRNCPEGSLFFALKGERFDGNQFAAEVLAKGCSLAVVDDPKVIPAGDSRYFLVPDVLTALQQLAAWHRQQLRNWDRPVTVIGITGTNGKTTTKELTHAVLSRKYNVLATAGNLNNHIGVPLTLLKITHEHELAIIEMGANHPMDIAELCAIVHPDFGLITNVGKAHLLGFGSFEGVIEAKTKLYESVSADGGTVFVDSGNPYLYPKAEAMQHISYSAKEDDASSEVYGKMTDCSPFLHLSLNIRDCEPIDVSTNLIGSYNLINAIAAAAVGHHFGVAPQEIQSALQSYEPQNMRSQLVDLGHGNKMILDAYNANPTSMMAALTSFNLNTDAHKMLLLGDMRELGEDSLAEHQRILQYLAQPEVTFGDILLVGSEFERAFESVDPSVIVALGNRASVRCYPDIDALCADEAVIANIGGTVLVKGSRGIKLEKIVEKLRG